MGNRGETIFECKKETTGTPEETIERDKRETTWRTRGNDLSTQARKTSGVPRENKTCTPEKEHDLRVMNQFHPGHREVIQRKKVDGTVPTLFWAVCHFSTCYLYRTDSKFLIGHVKK